MDGCEVARLSRVAAATFTPTRFTKRQSPITSLPALPVPRRGLFLSEFLPRMQIILPV